MKKLFKLIKTGKFQINVNDPKQCKEVGHKDYNYIVKIECGDKLDDNSFIIDNSKIHNTVINNIISSSCEKICKHLLNEIFIKLHENKTQIFSIEVEIFPEVDNVTTFISYKEIYQ